MEAIQKKIINREIPFHGVSNFRDLGGYKTGDGRQVKFGHFYRSARLCDLDIQDQLLFYHLQITNILDYRDEAEAKRNPNQYLSFTKTARIPAYTGTNKFSEQYCEWYQNETGRDMMKNYYQHLGFDSKAYHSMINLLRSKASVRFVQHCTYGKDRTGVGSAILLFLLGVDEQTIMEDYLLSNELLRHQIGEEMSLLSQQLDDRQLLHHYDVLSVREEYLQVFFDQIRLRYRTTTQYLQNEFHLNEIEIERIREKYLLSF